MCATGEGEEGEEEPCCPSTFVGSCLTGADCVDESVPEAAEDAFWLMLSVQRGCSWERGCVQRDGFIDESDEETDDVAGKEAERGG